MPVWKVEQIPNLPVKSLPPKTQLYEEGDLAEQAILLLRGVVWLERESAGGKNFGRFVESGSVIGYEALIPKLSNEYYGDRALSWSTVQYQPIPPLPRLMREPRVLQGLMSSLAERIVDTEALINPLLLKYNARFRIEAAVESIAYLAQKYPDFQRINHAQVAATAGVSRESVCKHKDTLRKLISLGLLRTYDPDSKS